LSVRTARSFPPLTLSEPRLNHFLWKKNTFDPNELMYYIEQYSTDNYMISIKRLEARTLKNRLIIY